MVQWLGLGAFIAVGQGSIPDQRGKNLQAAWCRQKHKNKQKNAYNKLLKVTLLVATIFFYFLSIWADINSTSFPCFVSNPLKRLQSRYYLHRVDEKAEIQIDNEACPGSWSLESSSVRMQSLSSSSSFFPPTYWVRT